MRCVGFFIRWCKMLSFLSDGAVSRAFHPMVRNVEFLSDGGVCRAFHLMVWSVEVFLRRCGM